MRYCDDVSGKKYGRLTAIRKAGIKEYKSGKKRVVWECKCECGNTIFTTAYLLEKGKTRSCGCYHKEIASKVHKKHGESNSPLYCVWKQLRYRCERQSHKQYKNYGGRGIKVCESWSNSFASFRDWAMSNGYRRGLSIDRIDVDGNYEPSNCRWITMKDQQNNRRNNHRVTYKENTYTISELAVEICVPYNTLYNILYTNGMNVEDAVLRARSVSRDESYL